MALEVYRRKLYRHEPDWGLILPANGRLIIGNQAGAWQAMSPGSDGSVLSVDVSMSPKVAFMPFIGGSAINYQYVQGDGHQISVIIDDTTIEVDGVSNTLQVKAFGISYGHIQPMNPNLILGRITASTGAVEALTASQVRTILGLVIGTDVCAQDDLRLSDARRPLPHLHRHAELAGLADDEHPAYALTNHSFVTAEVETRLIGERVLTAGANITIDLGTPGQVIIAATGGAAGNSFTTIDCPTGTDPVADSTADTLQLLAGSSKITISGDSAADSVSFDAVADDSDFLLTAQVFGR
jgi:hypothetical protein